MQLSAVYSRIDTLLAFIARIGSLAMVALVCITMYDVLTRYLNLPKFSGLNSTMVQESEYWAHGFLYSLFIGYAYTRQSHVRIDLVRDMFSTKTKYWLELGGIIVFLVPFASISMHYCFQYALRSFIDAEVSPSSNGLTNFWILKSALVMMFALILLAAISQSLKCIDGILGNLPEEESDRVLGGSH